MQCPFCNEEIKDGAKKCRFCGEFIDWNKKEETKAESPKKPVRKKWWFRLIIFFVLVGLLGSDWSSTTSTTSTNTPAVEKQEDNTPREYKNALKTAEWYAKMNFSKQRIYDQLTSSYGEWFSPESAQYAIDNLERDYKENALKTAENYQRTMNMSKNRIYEQLVSSSWERFTKEEAQYAIDNLPE